VVDTFQKLGRSPERVVAALLSGIGNRQCRCGTVRAFRAFLEVGGGQAWQRADGSGLSSNLVPTMVP